MALCFALAFIAERIGLAGIVGAFAAGLLLDPYGEGVRTPGEKATLSELLHPLSSLFVPLFFVLMGIQVDVGSLVTRESFAFGVVLVLVAVAGKLACAAGVVTPGINRLVVGIGMVPRGEVGLIFAGIGAALVLEGRSSSFPDGVLGARPDGGRHDARDADRTSLGVAAYKTGQSLSMIFWCSP